SRRRHTRFSRDWSSDVCSSDLYTFILFAASLLPFIIRMSGPLYAIAAVLLSGRFIYYAWQLHRHYSDALSRQVFKYSIIYLALLFAALLLDHWLAVF